MTRWALAAGVVGVLTVGVALLKRHSDPVPVQPAVRQAIRARTLAPAPHPKIVWRAGEAGGGRRPVAPGARTAAKTVAPRALFNFCYRERSGTLQLDGGRTAAGCERTRREVSAEGATQVGSCTAITVDAWRAAGGRAPLFSVRWTARHCSAIGWRG